MTTPPTFDTAERRARGTRSRLPRASDVLREQFRTIGFALRIPLLMAAAFAVLATIFIALQILEGDMEANLHTQPSAFPGVIGALLPIAVWAREERFGPGFLWTLPVDRSRHALIKVLAGWLWLMGGVAVYALCQLGLALVFDGGALPVRTLQVLTTAVPRSAPIDPAALRAVQWAPGALIWAVPFGAATAMYLFASAFMLGARHPLRWVIGAVLLVPVSFGASHLLARLLNKESLGDAPELLVDGRYGLDTLLKLRTWVLDRPAFLPTGERIQVWSAVPDLGDWLTAALLWIGTGLVVLWAAVSRHREQRRP